MADDSDKPIYTGKVYSVGTYVGDTHPEAWPYMINVIDHILRDGAAYGPEKDRQRYAELRRHMFDLFPEQKDGYISDPMNRPPE